MSVPGIVQSALGDEQVAAQVNLGGEDQLYVSPTRILIYRGEGLLSDETIEEYDHRAERVVVDRGRRKVKITLEHDLDGDRSFSVPANRLEDVLHPVLAGVLSTAGVTEAGETVKQTYRFSELTLIVTNRRLVKHVGSAVWDQDYEEYRFEDTTGLHFEEGSVATQIVLEVDGRRERIKAPNEQAPAVRAHLEEALFDFYDVSSLEEFNAAVADAEGDPDDAAPDPNADTSDGVDFESGLSPLSTGPDEGGSAAEAFGGDAADAAGDATGAVDQDAAAPTGGDEVAADPSGGPAAGGAADEQPPGGDGGAPAGAAQVDDASVEPDREEIDDAELARRLDDIARAVNKQNELLKRHQRTMEKLIDELQRMEE